MSASLYSGPAVCFASRSVISSPSAGIFRPSDRRNPSRAAPIARIAATTTTSSRSSRSFASASGTLTSGRFLAFFAANRRFFDAFLYALRSLRVIHATPDAPPPMSAPSPIAFASSSSSHGMMFQSMSGVKRSGGRNLFAYCCQKPVR